jgi:large subunit ribosomal protein L6
MINEVKIMDGVEVLLHGKKLVVKGKKGHLERTFKNPDIQVKVEGSKIIFSTDNERKKVKALIGTWGSLAKNMMSGVSKGWKAEVATVYQHFPIKLKVDKNKLYIENFLGEKRPRIVDIPSSIEVKVDKSNIIVSGVDKERVAQMAALIEQTTRIKGYDRRVFQDGCYITKKPHQVD